MSGPADAIARTAHDLRDPLNTLHLELLVLDQLAARGGVDPHDLRRALGVALRQVDRLARLVEALDIPEPSPGDDR